MAAFEGSIGLGTTFGYAVSGLLREAVGYAYVFLILMILHISAFVYILFFTKEIIQNDASANEIESNRNWLKSICGRFFDVISLFTAPRNPHKFRLLIIVLAAFSIELLAYSGVSDILYSYFRLRLGWGDKEYGWFDGLGSGFNTLAVLALYPYLHHSRNISNATLTIFGTVSKMIFLLILVFVWADWLAYLATIPSAFNRFISTGMRSLSTFYVTDSEQGKLFSLIALIEGVTGIIASLIFNGLYPLTLNFFSGTMIIAVLVAFFIPLVLMIYVKRTENKLEESNSSSHISENVIENS
uniref:Uncharacterized protein n=2 Tax=Acrobeloides nanus TaxID=290746 RepID=A0A914DQN3_9BILA